MANSISLELALHCNASNSPDACGSVKKNYQEDDDNYIIGTVIRPWLESRKLDAKVSPRCAAVVKFHARVYSHNCERSPTLSLCLGLGPRLLASRFWLTALNFYKILC